MKRVFIAVRIEPEEELLRIISEFRQGLRNEKIKWTENSNIHITLLFLGNTDEKRVDEIDTILKHICHGFGEFELVLKGAGVFRSIKDPRVIWTGILHSEEMFILNSLISKKMVEIGAVPEARPFSPHLTLGRIKRINDINLLSDLIDKYRHGVIQRIIVPEIILYESILHPEGPVYIPLGKYDL